MEGGDNNSPMDPKPITNEDIADAMAEFENEDGLDDTMQDNDEEAAWDFFLRTWSQNRDFVLRNIVKKATKNNRTHSRLIWDSPDSFFYFCPYMRLKS